MAPISRRLKESKLICGLDVGSRAVRIAVGQLLPGEEKQELHLLGAVECASEGVQKGTIVSIEDAVSSLSACLERAERTVGAPVETVWIGLSGGNILSQESRGVIAVSKPTGEISEEDVRRVVEAAHTVATPLNYEILHVIPRRFTVDGQAGIKDPVGMTGVRLEVDAHIVMGLSSHVKNLTKVIYRAGLDIDDVVLTILAVAEATTAERQRDLGVVVANMGSAATSIVVIEEGDLLHTTTIPIGGDHLTADIAIGLRTSIEVAERVKVHHGSASPKHISKRDEIDLFDLGGSAHETVSRKYIAQIIEARVEELMERIDKELKQLKRSGMLPSGAVFVGSGAKVEGFLEVAKQTLRLPASYGYPLHCTSVTERVNDIAFVPAISLVRWGAHIGAKYNTNSLPFLRHLKGGHAALAQVKGWIKSLLP